VTGRGAAPAASLARITPAADSSTAARLRYWPPPRARDAAATVAPAAAHARDRRVTPAADSSTAARLRHGLPHRARRAATAAAVPPWLYDALLEEVAAVQPSNPNRLLFNADIAPVSVAARTFSTWDMAALWVGLVVCVPSYTLVGSLLQLGFSAGQGLAIIAVRTRQRGASSALR
jgi:NCS1 family nucleobase:cation symporter-1